MRQLSDQNRPLIIGIVGHNLVRNDGQGRAMLELTNALAARGHEIHVYSTRIDSKLNSRPEIQWHYLFELPGPQLLVDLGILVASRRALKRTKHDAVCILGPCAFPREPFAYFAAFSQLGWRSAWRSRGQAPDLYRRIHSLVAEMLERRAVRRAHALLAMSPSTLRELDPLFREGGITAVVPGGIDLQERRATHMETRASARRRLNLQEHLFVIAFVGEYHTPRKGLDLLAAALRLEGSRSEIAIVRGSGPRRRTQRMLRKMSVEKKFILLPHGPTEDVYAAADVVVIPSIYEPFSIVALEAAAASLPIIISDRAGAAAYLAAREAALVVDASNPMLLRAALNRVQQETQMAKALGFKAREVAEEMSWEAVTRDGVGAIEAIAITRATDGEDASQ